nr:hypothetical protein Iba_chr13dCG11080 [Ipomoea batatas]
MARQPGGGWRIGFSYGGFNPFLFLLAGGFLLLSDLSNSEPPTFSFADDRFPSPADWFQNQSVKLVLGSSSLVNWFRVRRRTGNQFELVPVRRFERCWRFRMQKSGEKEGAGGGVLLEGKREQECIPYDEHLDHTIIGKPWIYCPKTTYLTHNLVLLILASKF